MTFSPRGDDVVSGFLAGNATVVVVVPESEGVERDRGGLKRQIRRYQGPRKDERGGLGAIMSTGAKQSRSACNSDPWQGWTGSSTPRPHDRCGSVPTIPLLPL